MSFYKATIRGTRPVVMHNGRLRDPLDPWAKKLSAAAKKRGKSEEDYGELSRIEFEAGMYFDKELGPYLPTDNLQSCMVEGARKRKLGKQFEALVEVVPPDSGPDGYKLDYKGPRDVESLWEDRDFVLYKSAKIGQAAVMRTRPRFATGWKCAFQIEVLDEAVTGDQVKQALEDAGTYCGIGDWTPRYGRFTVEAFAGI